MRKNTRQADGGGPLRYTRDHDVLIDAFFYSGDKVMDVTVRPARAEDIEQVVRFNQLMAQETEQLELDSQVLTEGVKAVVEGRQACQYFVAQCQQKVVGQCMVTYEWSDWRNAVIWWLQSVYVDSDYRRRGIFRRLYEAVRQAARHRNDCCGLRLYVEQENENAKQTYRNLGMSDTRYRVMEELW